MVAGVKKLWRIFSKNPPSDKDVPKLPVTASQAFGETYIGPITYVEFAGADHTALWNSAPALCEETVDAFMGALP